MLDAVDDDGLRLARQIDDAFHPQDIRPLEGDQDIEPAIEHRGIERLVKRQADGVNAIIVPVHVMIVMRVSVIVVMMVRVFIRFGLKPTLDIIGLACGVV